MNEPYDDEERLAGRGGIARANDFSQRTSFLFLSYSAYLYALAMGVFIAREALLWKYLLSRDVRFGMAQEGAFVWGGFLSVLSAFSAAYSLTLPPSVGREPPGRPWPSRLAFAAFLVGTVLTVFAVFVIYLVAFARSVSLDVFPLADGLGIAAAVTLLTVAPLMAASSRATTWKALLWTSSGIGVATVVIQVAVPAFPPLLTTLPPFYWGLPYNLVAFASAALVAFALRQMAEGDVAHLGQAT